MKIKELIEALQQHDSESEVSFAATLLEISKQCIKLSAVSEEVFSIIDAPDSKVVIGLEPNDFTINAIELLESVEALANDAYRCPTCGNRDNCEEKHDEISFSLFGEDFVVRKATKAKPLDKAINSVCACTGLVQ